MFTINYQSREPIYEQLYNNVVKLTGMGILHTHEKLPTVRAMASQLGINPNTVSKSYQMLETNGYIYSTVGKGSFVADNKSVLEGQQTQAKEQLIKAVRTSADVGITKKEVNAIVDNVFLGGENE